MDIMRPRRSAPVRHARRAATLLATALLLSTLPGHAVAADAAGQPGGQARSISGTVTVDGSPAAGGTVVIGEGVTEASAAPIRCGEATVSDAGTFSMELTAECDAGMAMRLVLADTGAEARDLITVPSTSRDGALVRFDRPQAGNGVAAQLGVALAGAEAEKSRPLIGSFGLMALLGLITVAVVVLLAFVAYQWAIFARHASTSATASTSPGVGTDRLLAPPRTSLAVAAQSTAVPQVLVEGLVLSLAIIAIVVLGASAKLTSEGLVSVLAAIVGYAAGRSVASAERRA